MLFCDDSESHQFNCCAFNDRGSHEPERFQQYHRDPGPRGECVRRPSEGLALGVAGVSAGVAAVAVAVAQLQLSGHPQADIWTNVWLDGALGLAGAGLLLAILFFLRAVFGRETRIHAGRLLVYSASARPLLAEPSAVLQNPDLQVAYRGKPVTTPYLVSFSLVSKGRTDIRSDDFDGGRPLTFDMGTAVTGLIDFTVPGKKEQAGDWFRIDGSNILIGPALIRAGQSINLSMLTSQPPTVQYQSSIAEATLEEKRSDEEKRSEGVVKRWAAARTIPVIAASLVATNLATGLLSHFLTSSAISSPPRASASTPSPASTSGQSGRANPGLTANMSFVSPQTGEAPELQSTPLMSTDQASGGIHSVAYSPDGADVATGDTNGPCYS